MSPTTSRDRQVVEIARAHLRGDADLVDALARDHLVDHPDSLVVAWIASDAVLRARREGDVLRHSYTPRVLSISVLGPVEVRRDERARVDPRGQDLGAAGATRARSRNGRAGRSDRRGSVGGRCGPHETQHPAVEGRDAAAGARGSVSRRQQRRWLCACCRSCGCGRARGGARHGHRVSVARRWRPPRRGGPLHLRAAPISRGGPARRGRR